MPSYTVSLMTKKSPKRVNCSLADSIQSRNAEFESAALESFSFRLPNLRLRAHFYYKLVDNTPYKINLHQHMHWEIARIVQGSARYEIPEYGKTLRPRRDRWLIIPPKISHQWSICKGPLVINSWQVQITAEDSRYDSLLTGMTQTAEKAGFLLPVLPEEDRADELFWDISGQPAFAFASGCIASGFGRVLIPSIIARLARWEPVNSGDRAVIGDKSRIALVERVQSFVEDNLQHDFSIKDIESHFHLSGRHLNRLFLKRYNVSIGRYMRESRMELGRRWLATTKRSVKDIALSLSYRSTTQFCRYFLQQFEMTPTEYRKQNHAEAAEFNAISSSRRKSKKIHNPFLTK